MRAPLSIVIPTLNAGGDLAPTLGCLIEGLEAGLVRDLVISDGGSSDATRAIADAAGAVWVAGAAGRGGQLGRGAAAAKGDWLLFLHADTCLAPGWAAAVQEHIAENPSRAGYFRLRFAVPGVGAGVVARWANLRARLFGLPFGDQGLLISRDLYDRAGGYRDIPLMEDVALARALKRRLSPLDAVAATGAGRYLHGGWLRTGARNLWTQVRFFAGVDPARLARDYRRQRRVPK